MILPVQRIPRYQLLIDQLVKFTWNEHCDFDNLTQALIIMKETAAYGKIFYIEYFRVFIKIIKKFKKNLKVNKELIIMIIIKIINKYYK